MREFNKTLKKLKSSQEKLSLLLFPKGIVYGAVYENCYVPFDYANQCFSSYFENVIFYGEGKNSHNSNYYCNCSVNRRIS